MATLGEGHFTGKIERIEGEEVVWEGGASRKGFWLHIVGALIAVTFIGALVFGLTRGFYAAAHGAMEDAQAAQEVATTDAEKAKAATDLERRIGHLDGLDNTLNLIFVLVSAGFFVVILIPAAMRCKYYWYVITTERICIQSGVFNRTIATIDLDKILSVKATSGWIERHLGLQHIELIHAGIRVISGPFGQLHNAYKMYYLDESDGILGKVSNEWLPRDNRGRAARTEA